MHSKIQVMENEYNRWEKEMKKYYYYCKNCQKVAWLNIKCSKCGNKCKPVEIPMKNKFERVYLGFTLFLILSFIILMSQFFLLSFIWEIFLGFWILIIGMGIELIILLFIHFLYINENIKQVHKKMKKKKK